jgi:hypothetical protein
MLVLIPWVLGKVAAFSNSCSTAGYSFHQEFPEELKITET